MRPNPLIPTLMVMGASFGKDLELSGSISGAREGGKGLKPSHFRMLAINISVSDNPSTGFAFRLRCATLSATKMERRNERPISPVG